MKKTIIYARVSTKDQKLDSQVIECTKYCEAKGFANIVVFQEKLSGTKASNRPELNRLMDMARRGEVSVVVCYNLDRFCRSLMDFMRLVTELHSYGVPFISLSEQIDITTPTGKLLTQILASIAEFGSSLTRQKTKDGLAAAKARGSKLGKRPRKIDWARVSELRAGGNSIRTIAKELGISKSALYERLKVS